MQRRYDLGVLTNGRGDRIDRNRKPNDMLHRHPRSQVPWNISYARYCPPFTGENVSP